MKYLVAIILIIQFISFSKEIKGKPEQGKHKEVIIHGRFDELTLKNVRIESDKIVGESQYTFQQETFFFKELDKIQIKSGRLILPGSLIGGLSGALIGITRDEDGNINPNSRIGGAFAGLLVGAAIGSLIKTYDTYLLSEELDVGIFIENRPENVNFGIKLRF
jgi:hypothetical protein